MAYTFIIGPVDGACAAYPCREGPCGCPTTICAVDSRSESPDYSGTYTKTGTYEGSIAYEKNGGGAWFWRDWDFFPEQGWWVVSTTKGDASDGVTQDETGVDGEACPDGDYWTGLGSVVEGAC